MPNKVIKLLKNIGYSTVIFFIAGVWSIGLIAISRKYFGIGESNLSRLFIFAVIITIIAVLSLFFLGIGA